MAETNQKHEQRYLWTCYQNTVTVPSLCSTRLRPGDRLDLRAWLAMQREREKNCRRRRQSGPDPFLTAHQLVFFRTYLMAARTSHGGSPMSSSTCHVHERIFGASVWTAHAWALGNLIWTHNIWLPLILPFFLHLRTNKSRWMRNHSKHWSHLQGHLHLGPPKRHLKNKFPKKVIWSHLRYLMQNWQVFVWLRMRPFVKSSQNLDNTTKSYCYSPWGIHAR